MGGSSQSVVLPRRHCTVPRFVLGLVRESWEVRWCFQCQQLLQGKGIREEKWDRKAEIRSSAGILPPLQCSPETPEMSEKRGTKKGRLRSSRNLPLTRLPAVTTIWETSNNRPFDSAEGLCSFIPQILTEYLLHARCCFRCWENTNEEIWCSYFGGMER